MFFCPYRGAEVGDAEHSLEHVIAEGLGGSNNFSIPADRKANNDLGSELDEPLGQFYAFQRVTYDIRAKSGKAPVFSVPTRVGDGDGSARLELTPNGTRARVKPDVQRSAQPDGTLTVSILGDADTARRIERNLRRSYETKGYSVGPALEVEKPIHSPVITSAPAIEPLVAARYATKLALGTGHWLWGEKWSKGEQARQLRCALWSKTEAEFLSHLPESRPATPAEIGLRVEPHEHVIYVEPTPTEGCAFGMFLFGQPGCLFRVSQPETQLTGSRPVLVILDVRTRSVTRQSPSEMERDGRFIPAQST